MCTAGADAVAEQWEPLMSPLYLQSCWLQLQQTWEAAGIGAEAGKADSSPLRQYLHTQQLPQGDGGLLGAYLQLCDVPAVPRLRSVLERVQHALQEMQLGDGPEARGAAAALLAAACKGMPVETAQAIVAAAAVA